MKILSIRFMSRLARTLICLALFFSALVGLKASQECADLSFPEMDAILIRLHYHAESNNRTEADEQISLLLSEWERYVKPTLAACSIPHLNTELFMVEVESLLEEICLLDERADLSELEAHSWSLLEMFHSLRVTFGRSFYPIDLLLELDCQYDDFSEMINDPMLSLREWYELEESICAFHDTWADYDGLNLEYIQSFWPSFNIQEHLHLKSTLGSCLSDLVREMKTAYRHRLEEPCEEMGTALSKLVVMYGKVQMERKNSPIGKILKHQL